MYPPVQREKGSVTVAWLYLSIFFPSPLLRADVYGACNAGGRDAWGAAHGRRRRERAVQQRAELGGRRRRLHDGLPVRLRGHGAWEVRRPVSFAFAFLLLLHAALNRVSKGLK